MADDFSERIDAILDRINRLFNQIGPEPSLEPLWDEEMIRRCSEASDGSLTREDIDFALWEMEW